MAVLLETSKGDLVIDLFVDDAPNACKNFLKLCKLKYYNNSLFHNVQRHFLAQAGDPTGSGKGGDSVYGLMYGSQARFFDDEVTPKRRHTAKGSVGMASAGPNLNGSQFYITLADELSSLDERRTLFGQVSEGLEVLEALNDVPVDAAGRPLQNIRIRHAIILDDPFDDPEPLAELLPDASPPPAFEHGDRLEEDWVPPEDDRPDEEIEKEAAAAEAKNRAVVLEMIGDLPEAEAKPPSNMLFVCKLNPVTTEEDLEIIFSRFGNVTSCDIIRDHKTGDSLCYAFIGYDSDEACEAAYFKMNNVLIDDRRIRVDFSQSVAHIWKQFRRHGKAGGSAATAAEADAHNNDGGGGGWQQQQQQRGPPASRYIDLKGPRGPVGGGGGGTNGGLLFDQHHHPEPAQQPTGQQRAPRRQRWDEERAPRRSRSRSPMRSRSSSRERRHKHKKQKKEKHHKHDDRDEREAPRHRDGSRGAAVDDRQHHQLQQQRIHRDGSRDRQRHDDRDRDRGGSRDRGGYEQRQRSSGRGAEDQHRSSRDRDSAERDRRHGGGSHRSHSRDRDRDRGYGSRERR